VSNVLSEENKHQVIALGRLGWSLRRIQRATGVRRETAATYLRAAGIANGQKYPCNSEPADVRLEQHPFTITSSAMGDHGNGERANPTQRFPKSFTQGICRK